MRSVLTIQAIYYLVTGVWPLISLRTFEAVTGPKTDDWLVQTVGVLAAVIGTSLLIGSRSFPVSRETLVLSSLSALGFAAVDVFFVLRGTISRIYLIDVVLQAVLMTWLLLAYLLLNRQSVAD